MELLDVVDENNKLTGKQEDKDVIHEKGLWHREVEVWIANERGELLTQKRSSTLKQAPNKWSITAGHVDAGENVDDAIIREMKEEIGIHCKKEELTLFLVTKHQALRGNNNSFRYIYFYRTNKEISDFTMQKEEVEELKYITLQELEKMVEQQHEDYLFHTWEYISEVIQYLKNHI